MTFVPGTYPPPPTTSWDEFTPDEIRAANPGGVPDAVSVPGGVPFRIPGATLPATGGSGIGGQGSGAGFYNLPDGGTGSTPAATAVPNTASATPVASAAAPGAYSSAPEPGSWADYFARAIIVVLGFIFIAVGLNMLRPGTVPIARLPR